MPDPNPGPRQPRAVPGCSDVDTDTSSPIGTPVALFRVRNSSCCDQTTTGPKLTLDTGQADLPVPDGSGLGFPKICTIFAQALGLLGSSLESLEA